MCHLDHLNSNNSNNALSSDTIYLHYLHSLIKMSEKASGIYFNRFMLTALPWQEQLCVQVLMNS